MSTAVKNRAQKRRSNSTRVNLRIDPAVKAVLFRAAKLQRVKLTEFMVRASQVAAEMALAERNRFILPAIKWAEFNEALDSPPRDIAALRKLLSEKSVFESA